MSRLHLSIPMQMITNCRYVYSIGIKSGLSNVHILISLINRLGEPGTSAI